MDITEIRVVSTVVMFLLFIGILAWAYARPQKERFARAALIPFEEDDVLPQRDAGGPKP